METDRKENACGSCTFFCRHYIMRYDFFQALDYGHCVRPGARQGKDNFYGAEHACGSWQPDKEKRERAVASAPKILRRIERQLHVVAEIEKSR